MALRIFSVSLILLSALYFLFSFNVFAQAPAPAPPDQFLGVNFTIQDVAAILTGFACWLIGIVLVIMVIFLVWAGIRFFLSRGNEVALGNAKKNMTWTLVGILVILATNVIIATVANALGADYSFIPLDCVNINTRFGRPCQSDSDCPAGQGCLNPDAQGKRICGQVNP